MAIVALASRLMTSLVLLLEKTEIFVEELTFDVVIHANYGGPSITEREPRTPTSNNPTSKILQ
jgi:hypothetical protein